MPRPMTAVDEPHALRVLMVENDRGLCRLVELILKREGWKVTSASDGYLALDVLRRDLPDVLLLDLRPSETSCLNALDWIEKTNPSWLSHVIVFTAAPDKVIAGLERRHGTCRVLRKPFDIADLVHSIALCAEDGIGQVRGTEHQAWVCQ